MTYNEHLLTILGEEGVEVSQRATKALRFSLDEVQPGQPLTNGERIMLEFADLVAMVEMCRERGMLPPLKREHVEAKKVKVAKFLEYSRECGTVDANTEASDA